MRSEIEFSMFRTHGFQSTPSSFWPSDVTLRRMAEMIFNKLRFPVEKCAVVGVQFVSDMTNPPVPLF